MDELTIGDKVYISTKRAAALTGYAKDYIGQLCREGRVEAKLVGRSWYVREESLRGHRFGEEETSQPAVTEDKAARFMEITYTPEPIQTLPSVAKPAPVVVAKEAPPAPVAPIEGEPVRMHIAHSTPTLARAVDVLAPAPRPTKKPVAAPARRAPVQGRARKSYLVLKAILTALVLLVVSIAVIGSGSLDYRSVNDENPVISFIRGVNVYDRSK